MIQQRIEFAHPGCNFAVAWVAPGLPQAIKYIAKLRALNPKVMTRVMEVKLKDR